MLSKFSGWYRVLNVSTIVWIIKEFRNKKYNISLINDLNLNTSLQYREVISFQEMDHHLSSGIISASEVFINQKLPKIVMTDEVDLGKK